MMMINLLNDREIIFKNLERKRKFASEAKPFNGKSSLNNIRKKFKTSFINILLNFINNKISEIYLNNICKGINRKQLIKISPLKYNVDFNKKLINLTLAEIFSNKISPRYIYSSDFNKVLINRFINEEDLDKRKIIINLFNKTFLECLEHFRGTKYIKGLEGLENEYFNFVEHLGINEDDNDYIYEFINVIYTFEKYIENKKSK